MRESTPGVEPAWLGILQIQHENLIAIGLGISRRLTVIVARLKAVVIPSPPRISYFVRASPGCWCGSWNCRRTRQIPRSRGSRSDTASCDDAKNMIPTAPLCARWHGCRLIA